LIPYRSIRRITRIIIAFVLFLFCLFILYATGAAIFPPRRGEMSRAHARLASLAPSP